MFKVGITTITYTGPYFGYEQGSDKHAVRLNLRWAVPPTQSILNAEVKTSIESGGTQRPRLSDIHLMSKTLDVLEIRGYPRNLSVANIF